MVKRVTVSPSPLLQDNNSGNEIALIIQRRTSHDTWLPWVHGAIAGAIESPVGIENTSPSALALE
jgi:hypothetical protein